MFSFGICCLSAGYIALKRGTDPVLRERFHRRGKCLTEPYRLAEVAVEFSLFSPFFGISYRMFSGPGQSAPIRIIGLDTRAIFSLARAHPRP